MNYCPNCGQKLEFTQVNDAELKKCECGYIDWDNWVNISTVVVAFNEHREFVMVTLKGKEEGKITFPGGFRNLGETLEEAANREFHEETGYSVTNLRLFKAYTLDHLRLVWIAYIADLKEGQFIENEETSRIDFISIANFPRDEDLRGILTRKLLNEIKALITVQ